MCLSNSTVFSTCRHLANRMSMQILRPKDMRIMLSQNQDEKSLQCNPAKRGENSMTCISYWIHGHTINMVANQMREKEKSKTNPKKKIEPKDDTTCGKSNVSGPPSSRGFILFLNVGETQAKPSE